MMRLVWIVVVLSVKCLAMSRNELEDFSDYLKKTSQLDLSLKKGADPDDIFDEDEEVSDHAWEESGKFEGDLILNDRQRRLIVENVEGLSRNGLTDSTKRWPNNEVIYFIQKEHFNSDQVQAIESGIEDLGRASCVKFRPYVRGDRDAVVIQGSRRGCFSQVGYQGGYQVLNLSGRHPAGRGCFRHGTVVHELLHTLGFYHMQSSPDRDDYINVHWENILQPARHNFRKYNSFSVSDFGVGYDYDSVLHYSRRAFSSNGKDTLVPKQSGASIGQRVGLSDKDTQKLNKMYCDPDTVYDAIDVPLKPKNKKKKPKNKPFEGHGIGYHQGKTVIIKVPTSETLKLPPNPTIVEFDFRRPPQALPPSQTEDHRFGKELVFPYSPPNVEMYQNGYKSPENTQQMELLEQKHVQNASVEKDKQSSESNESGSNEEKTSEEDSGSEELDEDVEDSYDKLVALVKQRVYPKNKKYPFKINEDYSTFYSPTGRKPADETFSGKYKETVLYDDPESNDKEIVIKNHKKEIPEKHSHVPGSKPIAFKNFMDSTYRTSLPNKKPFSYFEQIEGPEYASRDYLKDRHNYAQYYNLNKPKFRETIEIPQTRDDWFKKDYLKKSPEKYDYSESSEDEPDEESSLKYYKELPSKLPKRNARYVVLDSVVPSKQSWYSPNYSIPNYQSQSYFSKFFK